MMERIYQILRAEGIDVRLATLHVGLCAKPYCVLYEGTAESGRSVAARHALIDVLVPAAHPETLFSEAERVRAAMARAGHGKCTVNPAVALDDYKAVSITLDFTILCGL